VSRTQTDVWFAVVDAVFDVGALVLLPVNPGKQGTKVAADYRVKVAAGQSKAIRLRLSKSAK
jgi:hypothetical protein